MDGKAFADEHVMQSLGACEHFQLGLAVDLSDDNPAIMILMILFESTTCISGY